MGKVIGGLVVVVGGIYVLYKTKPEIMGKVNDKIKSTADQIKSSFWDGYTDAMKA